MRKIEKEIKDFPKYTITEKGEVFSYHFKKPRLLKGFISHNGYCYVDLCNNGGKERKAVHRLVAEYFVQGYFEGAVVNHKDGNTKNNNVSNLDWVTQAENIKYGYINSGVGATRNYRKYRLVYPNGDISKEEFIGFPKLKEFILNNHIELSLTSLEKYGRTGEYKILKYK